MKPEAGAADYPSRASGLVNRELIGATMETHEDEHGGNPDGGGARSLPREAPARAAPAGAPGGPTAGRPPRARADRRGKAAVRIRGAGPPFPHHSALSLGPGRARGERGTVSFWRSRSPDPGGLRPRLGAAAGSAVRGPDRVQPGLALL